MHTNISLNPEVDSFPAESIERNWFFAFGRQKPIIGIGGLSWLSK